MTTLHEELKALHERMHNPENWRDNGICDELPPRYRGFDGFKSLCMKWPESSGNTMFPVRHPYLSNKHKSAYMYTCDPEWFWDRKTSPYAAARWRLLEWAIEQTKPK